MSTDTPADAVRRFNRFYTRHVGALNEVLLQSDYSLPECRILWELGHLDSSTATQAEGISATALGRLLQLDAGYLSRLLRGLKERGLVLACRSTTDGRQQLLRLSAAGQAALVPLEARSQAQAAALLAGLGGSRQAQLLQAMQQVQELLGDPAAAASAPAPDYAPQPGPGSLLLRPPRPGDMGWVIARHGALYAREFQWDMRFEALVARIAADFVEQFDPTREACWIAERDGANVGCVFVVQAREEGAGGQPGEPIPGVAQLRMLLIEPTARGLGLGDRLVAQCHRFAQDAGYQRVRLWTNSNLAAARHIYTKAGYQLLSSAPYEGFGQSLVGEIWELDLAQWGNAARG